MLTLESRRQQFPSLERMAYLNIAAKGIPPLLVHEALDEYFRDKQLGMDGRGPHFASLEETQALVGDFYGPTGDMAWGVGRASASEFGRKSIGFREQAWISGSSHYLGCLALARL